jgi:hypothetical protein
MNEVLAYLQTHGDRLDEEIAEATKLSLSKTRFYLAELAAKGEVVTYHSTRFLDGQKIEGIRCMISGIAPKAAPRRKSRVSEFN